MAMQKNCRSLTPVWISSQEEKRKEKENGSHFLRSTGS